MRAGCLATSLFLALIANSGIGSGTTVPNHAVILQYHHVSNETPAITSISPDKFLQHLTYIEQQGFNVESLETIIHALQANQPVPDKTIAITFDDAYLSIYDTAWPMLRARGWPSTVFVSTALVGSNSTLYMDWNQLRELHKHGVFIANHTQSHTHLLRQLEGESRGQWLTRIEAEITGAQERIQDELGYTANIFAYPYGEYDYRVKQLLARLDYVALGQHSGPVGEIDDWQAIPRFPASGIYSDLDTLKVKLMSLPFPVTEKFPSTLLAQKNDRPILSIKMREGGYQINGLACYATAQGRIEVYDRSEYEFKARASVELAVGRSRYNCTAPTMDGTRYYWFSQPFIRKNADGSWYPEP